MGELWELLSDADGLGGFTKELGYDLADKIRSSGHKARFTQEELDFMLSFKDKVRENQSNTEDIYILENQKLLDIKKLCENALNDYLLQVYDPINPNNISLKITHSWLNFTKKGQFHHPHTHHRY